MGNCQAADAATVVIQHPRGRVERLYWPVTAREVMKSNPGYYVALVTLCQSQGEKEEERRENNGVRFTRVKLLRPKDTLILGNVYRLVTSQEIMKGLWVKKYGRTGKKNPFEPMTQRPKACEGANALERRTKKRSCEPEKMINKEEKQDEHGSKATQSAVGRSSSRHWRPSLNSISEVNRLPQSDAETY